MSEHIDQPLELLSPVERWWYHVADVVERRLAPVQICWNRLFMVNMVRLLGGRRLRVEGLEELERYSDQDAIILVANHRSFFDYFVIGAMLYTRTSLSKRILFPVRAPFFYDHPLGGLVNALMAGFTMFPPILRDKERADFNRFSVERILAAMRRPGQLLGFHPEGKRGRGPDPYELLRAQPGVGRIVLRAPEARILPVMILGLSNSMWTELVRNWTAPGEWPIDVWFGPEVEVDALREQTHRLATQIRVSRRCNDAIRELLHRHRDRYAS